jgi:WD40 repeat protein
VYIPQFKYLISGSVDGTVAVYTDTCLEVQVVEFSGGVFCMDYSPRESNLVVGGNATFALYKVSPINMRQLIRYHNHQRMLKSDKLRQRNALIDDASEISFRALDTGSQGMVQLRGAESGHTDVIKAILCLANGRFVTAG